MTGAGQTSLPQATTLLHLTCSWRAKHRVLHSYLHCIQLERLFVQQAHVRGLIDADCVLVHAGKVPAAATKAYIAGSLCRRAKGAQQPGLLRRQLAQMLCTKDEILLCKPAHAACISMCTLAGAAPQPCSGKNGRCTPPCQLQVLMKWQGAKLSMVRCAARELPAAADSSCAHLSSLPPAHLKTGHRSTPAGPAAVPTANSSTLPVKLRSLRPAAQGVNLDFTKGAQ